METTKAKLASDMRAVIEDTKALLKIEAADKAVRTHPYESVGIGFAVGLLVGFLIGRR
jgi:ElaB/YqjD/DUF883 family membrane-anchored ribosome-binding protein